MRSLPLGYPGRTGGTIFPADYLKKWWAQQGLNVRSHP